ncbi:MAG: ABC transporter permease [Acidobacteriota bacterium]
MNSLMQDLRFAFRLFGRKPVTHAVIVLTLGLGIGANVGMFAGFDAWVLRPLDFEAPQRLLALYESRPRHGNERHGVAPANLRDWQDESQTLERLSFYQHHTFNFHHQDDPDRVRGARVDVELFPLLGKEPVLGRGFRPEEGHEGGPAVALISHELWQERFAGDPAVAGRTVRLDGEVYEIVGVMPAEFEFPQWEKLWTPLQLPATGGARNERSLRVVARLAPGVGLAEANAELAAIAGRLEAQYPETNEGWSALATPLREEWSPPVVQLALTVSVVAAAAVLLVICANVANLLLAQATGRRQEVALRTALGASRGRLARQIVTEGVLLALAGGVVGVMIGQWWVHWMMLWAPIEPPYLFRFAVDARALAYTLAVAMAAGAVCALGPMARSSGLDVSESLRSGGGRMAGGAGSQRFRSALVVGQMALSVLLLIGALLMVKSFVREQQIDPGFRTADVLTLKMAFDGTGYESPEQRVAVTERIADRIARVGGVESAGVTNRLPIGFVERRWIEAEGRPLERGTEPVVAYHSVSEGYLEALELPPREGRGFTAGEATEGAAVAVVSRALADRLWPRGDVLEQRIRWLGENDDAWRRVIGVVDDIDPGHSMASADVPRMQVYVPYGSDPTLSASLVVATHRDPLALSAEIREALRQAAPGVPISDVLRMEQAIERVHWVSGFFSRMFIQYAVIALLIAALGAYGVVADSVSQRTREMGIRLALGARPAALLRQVVAQGAWLGLAGVALGLLAAVPTTRFLASMLYEVSATDPAVFGAVAALLLIAAMLAAYIPARRAAQVNPIEVLRFE